MHIFTDDADTQGLLNNFQFFFPDPRVEIHTRLTDNRHDKNVIIDFFSMMNFDVFIRTNSSFSNMIYVLSDHKLSITPTRHEWVGNCLVITETEHRWKEKRYLVSRKFDQDFNEEKSITELNIAPEYVWPER